MVLWFTAILLSAARVEAMQTNVSSICSPSDPSPLVVKGSITYVCVNVNDKYRTLFTPIADKFIVLRISDSWNDTRIGANPSGAFVTVSSLKYRTNYKLYSSTSKGRLSPYMTAIISVKMGVVQGVSWDEGCYFCTADMCDYNLFSKPEETAMTRLSGQGKTCYTFVDNCSATNASKLSIAVGDGSIAGSNATVSGANTSAQCDITVYLGWTGTDKYGEYLGSASLRMSQFSKYSIGSFFSSIGASLSKLAPTSRSDIAA
ncbi:RxLR-like protein [Plasmopara halstedii]|uniref:RxLR-like protein n=1 Tax=Plasmopara halstedii TaxID=4781 RepID=A0A0P1AZ72_PLAHL|nr:RxLR-like protein [Plasmopara halstedii]CEG47109.1 RxLR-like protein [Plasmopara halstedii]|eukprot:XP_024583478.1 RxLR-like protein [Plasmopara halstedii]